MATSWKQTQRVGQSPTVVNALTHSFTWVSDADINALIIQKYRLYSYLTPDDTANAAMLAATAAEWHDYFDHLYETTQYDYDPILNYDKHIEGIITDAHHKGSKTSVASSIKSTETPRVATETQSFSNGFNSADTGVPDGMIVNPAPTGTNEIQTTGAANANYSTTEDLDATHFDKDERSYTDYREYGNIGVMTTQDIILKERQIIIDVLDEYIKKFADCFDLDTCILGGWLSDEEE